jgi:GT2 family glycosyltransferase
LLRLDFKDTEIIFLDNASSDGSVEFILKHYPSARVVANKDNSGYAGGANQAVEVSRGEFVLIMNPDIVFEPDYLKALMRRLEVDRQIGAIIGKLRKYDFKSGQKTNFIDSAGLVMYRNRRCVDRGQGEEDHGQFDHAEEVFGITGACPLYRRAALEDCKIAGEYLDNSFFMYKEDVDISWRMRLFGWKCFYEPRAVAYHGRGTGVVDRSTLWTVAKERKGLSKFQKYYSYKNERLMRVKNELWVGVRRDFVPILWKEFLMMGWMIFREPFLWKSLGKFLLQLPNALWKRREIMRRKRVDAEKIGKWFI